MPVALERPRTRRRAIERLASKLKQPPTGREIRVTFRLHPKQQAALQSPATEILYGGAAGGGKSHLMRVAAITWCLQVAGLQCYLFRRSYKELTNSHMKGPTGFPELLSGLVAQGYARVTKHRIVFYNGAVIELNHLQNIKTLSQHQGTDIHVLLIDELTHFEEEEYKYLFTRVRMPDAMKANLPANLKDTLPRVLGATNPGGRGHHWVKARFIEKDDGTKMIPMALYNYKGVKGSGEKIRQFIPARLEDNPSLDAEEYGATLEGQKDPIMVRALREGDWDVVAGAMFGGVWHDTLYGRPWHVHDGFRIPEGWDIWRGGDDGFDKPSAVYWLTQDPDRETIYVIDEIYETNLTAPELATKILDKDREIQTQDGFRNPTYNREQLRGAYDSSAFADRGDADAKGQKVITRGDQMNRMGCKWEPVAKWPGSRVAAAQNFHRLLASNAKAPLLRDRDGNVIVHQGKQMHDRPGIVFFKRCANAIRTIKLLPRDPDNSEDVDTKAEDHCFVAGTMVMTEFGERPIETLTDGERVQTRYGLRAIKRATCREEKTVTVRFNNGTTLTGTPGHPVMTNNGWTPLYFMTECGTFAETWMNRIASVKQSKASEARLITCVDDISNATELGCIEKFGKARQVATYPKDFTCTIATQTGRTIEATTWNYSEDLTICRRTEKLLLSAKELPAEETLSLPRSLTERSNRKIERQRHEADGRVGNLYLKSAKNAANRLTHTASESLVSAAERAKCEVYAEQVEPSGTQVVYNIEVDDEPEYYANGILVHNSWDGVRYGVQFKHGRRSGRVMVYGT